MNLKLPEQSFDALTDFANALPDAVIALDENAAIQWWNTNAGQWFSLKKGQDIQTIIPDFSRHFVPCEAGNSPQGPYKLTVRKSPLLKVAFYCVDCNDEQKLLIARNISHVELLEKMRQDFIANVSHEMRTPLTVIRGYLETLLDRDADELQPWKRAFDQMYQQSARMERLVEDLLLLSQLEVDSASDRETEVINIPQLLTSIQSDALALSGDQAHQIHLSIDTDEPFYGNFKEIRSAFSNIVFNAVRYTPEGGRIDISWSRDADGLHFSVRDTGIGFEPKHIPRLTERFYRVDRGRSRSAGGTGLGLAIVKHVLLRHQGRLHVESCVGAGSLFRCDFSLCLNSAPPSP